MRDPGTRAVAGLALAFFAILLLPSLSPHYGFYSDELYYLACTKRLAWGYVDQPPLFVFALRLQRELFGDSLVALRALPAAAGAASVLLTGWMAGRLGGGTYARVLACLAWMVGQALAMFGIFTVNCFGILLWTAASALLLELCRSRNPRGWVALGVVLGLAFLSKHTIAVWIAGLAGATLLSRLRSDLATPWPWAGAAAFALLALPNLLWQVQNDWPSIPFYLSRTGSNPVISPLEVVLQQVLVQNPATLPVWIAGLVFLLRAEGGAYRPLAGVFGIVFGLAMLGGQSVPYRIAGAYPVLFAAGGVWLDARRRRDAGRLRRAWDRLALPTLMLAFGALAASLALPILPPERVRDHPLHSGDGWRVAVGEAKRPPYHLANRTHWPQLTAEVAHVYAGLDPGARADAVLLADYFGHAGAFEYYGAAHGLPPVYSPHTGYALWGPPPHTPGTLISVGIDPDLLRRHYRVVRTASVFRCELCPAWQDALPIRVASQPKTTVEALWAELLEVGGMHRYRRLLAAQGEPVAGPSN